MVNTPVLFLTFVRVDYARQVWEAIKASQPAKLYFYSNKGRAENEGEIERNNEIRNWIKEVTWECELHTWFRDECVDVYTSLRGAITWLFENEEEGIILEDDCVPSMAFFSYCDQLLSKFKNDYRVWCISGDNFLNVNPSGYDYVFSRHHWMYGWASWRSRWEKIRWGDYRIEETLNTHMYYNIFRTKAEAKLKEKDISDLKDFLPKTDCWDYAFGLVIDQENGLTIYPKEHLITNIGIEGTHHQGGSSSVFNRECEYKGATYEIIHEPPFVFADTQYDILLYNKLWKGKNLLFRGINKVGRLLRNMIKSD